MTFRRIGLRLFKEMRSPRGEHMILDENAFIEVLLPRLIIRRLSDAEMEAYRRPFRERAARLPMLIWPRELPIGGEPADIVAWSRSMEAGWPTANCRSCLFRLSPDRC